MKVFRGTGSSFELRATPINLVLADDDLDDCKFFEDALEELNISAELITVNDGVQLMQLLFEKEESLPDALYLDLNMPRKNGFDCITEIKLNERLKQLPIIILSTSSNTEITNLLYQKGADYYICKPAEFSNLKKLVFRSLTLIFEKGEQQPLREKFVLAPV